MTKRCWNCKISQPLENFAKDRSKWDGLNGTCKECAHKKVAARTEEQRRHNRETTRKWAETHREHNQAKNRAYRIKTKYGLTVEQYEAIVNAPCCAICQRETKLVLDHDHATGKIRGAICSSCNSGLGHAHDDPNILEAAAQYLESFQ